MATYPELAAQVDLQVSTPNEQLFARLRGKYDVSVAIAPGYAERAGDDETAAQLNRLSRLLFMHRADRLNKIQNETLEPLGGRIETEEDREFQRRYAEITVTDSSADGAVGVTVVGLTSWSWQIARGTIDQHDGQWLGEVVTEIANRVVRRLADEVRRLSIAVYHHHG